MSRPILIGVVVLGGLALLGSAAASSSSSPSSSSSVTLHAGKRYRLTVSAVPGVAEIDLPGFRAGIQSMGNTIESLENDPTKVRVTFSSNAPLAFERTITRTASLDLYGKKMAIVIDKIEEIK